MSDVMLRVREAYYELKCRAGWHDIEQQWGGAWVCYQSNHCRGRTYEPPRKANA